MHGDERWLTYAALAISMIDREDIWRGLRKCMYNDLELVKFNQSVFWVVQKYFKTKMTMNIDNIYYVCLWSVTCVADCFLGVSGWGELVQASVSVNWSTN